jgi:NAD(P)-dependent dehydrogenase (short-subunit alcohol dehydrogenase family)
MRELAGRVAVITGAGSGIGRALALRLAAERMKVVIADVDVDGLAGTASALRDAGAEILTLPTDVAREEAVEALAARTVETFGAVHLLCNNAGVFSRIAPVWEQSPADWQRVLGVNLYGVIHGIRAFLPRMLRQQDEGHIVNTASEAGFTSRPLTSVYNASKHAVLTLSESLAFELARIDARVGVSPRSPPRVATALREHAPSSGAERDTILRSMRGGVARGMDPTEVAEHVVRAVRESRFYIFTHPAVKDAIRARIDAALAEHDPVLNAGFLRSDER